MPKGWRCPRCQGPATEAKQIEKPGRWVVEARCEACDVKLVITKSGTRVER